MLDRVAIYKEKGEATKQKIKKAIKYPITVLCIAAVVTAVLLIKVVPVFASMFADFDAELPAITQVVVALSEWVQEWWLMTIFTIAATITGMKEATKRSKRFADRMDEIKLKLPMFGDILYKGTVARFSRTLSTTFSAGVPLIDALNSCAGAAGNSVYYKAIMAIREDVTTGVQLQFAMKKTGLFPTMALQMVSIGEESGALDAMLEKVAIYFEDEVDSAVDGLTSMIEPIMMAFLGVVIGGLMVAMYMPMFQMGSIV